MKTIAKKTILLLFLTLLFCLGCEKEKLIEVPVDKQYRWKLDSNFVYDNSIISNSFATENELYLYGKYFSVLTYDAKSNEKVVNYRLQGGSVSTFKLPISSSFFVNTYQNTVYFIPTLNPVLEYSYSYYKFGYNNPNLSTIIASMPYDFGQSMAINSKNQVLIPYTSFDPTQNIALGGGTYSFLMADILIKLNGQRIEVDKTKTITVNNNGYPVNNLFANKDYFIASVNSNYKIYSDGKFKQIAPNYTFLRVFQKSDTLYAFGSDGSLLRSVNDADDWSKLGKIEGTFPYSNYYLINNEIIGTYFGQLFIIKIEANNITVKEIDNDGLVTHYITSISKFKDKVFVTTLTGVYKIDYKDFYKYK